MVESGRRPLKAEDHGLELHLEQESSMWHTQEGDRKLEGKERALFVHAAVELYDLLGRAEGAL